MSPQAPQPADGLITLRLPQNFVGQVLDGLEVLIDEWAYTAEYLEHGAVRQDMVVRDCHKPEEARRMAASYSKIYDDIAQQYRAATGE